MNFQIRNIVIFNPQWVKKEVSFKEWLNLITWHSKTWKSALLEIINYCFFSKFSNIPVWKIKDFAYLYAIVLEIEWKFIVLWREEEESKIFHVFHTESPIGLTLNDFNSENKISLIDGRKLLLRLININIEEKYGTQENGSVSIRNMLPLILQPQHLIANKYALFIWFDDYYTKTAIIEDFFFFTKKVNSDYLKTKRRIDQIEKNIKRNDIKVKSNNNLFSDIQLGLKDKIIDFLRSLWEKDISDDFNKLIEIDFNKIFEEKFNSWIYGNDIDWRTLFKLKEERDEIDKSIQSINNKLKVIDLSTWEIDKYYNNIKEASSLISELSSGINDNELNCPLCSHIVDKEGEENRALFLLSENFDNDINEIELYDNKIDSKKESLLDRKKTLKKEISNINKEISSKESLSNNNNYTIYQKLIKLKLEINTLKQYLKHLRSNSNILDTDNDEISELDELKIKLNKFNLDKTNMSAYLNNKISIISKKLDIEDKFKKLDLEFDLENFSLSYKDISWDITLSEIWSWANILALHLSLFIGFLWISLKTSSYLPKFIFIDQPSQVYFPDSMDDSTTDKFNNKKDKDIRNVENFFIVMLEELDWMKKEFWYTPQIIVTDHANNLDLWDYKFSNYVRANWRDWEALI